ncbi:MAG: hypothetical protein WCJ64_20465 [Rhodospirillaceae bacterium]
MGAAGARPAVWFRRGERGWWRRRTPCPVLAPTADAMVEHRKRYFATGVDEPVSKPVDRDALAAALESHTARTAKPG